LRSVVSINIIDKKIIDILKDNAMEVRDISNILRDDLRKSQSIMPYSQQVSLRLRKLKSDGVVVMKKIQNKYFWGIKKDGIKD